MSHPSYPWGERPCGPGQSLRGTTPCLCAGHGLRVPRGQRGATALRVRGGGGGAGQLEVVAQVVVQAGIHRGAEPAAVARAVPTA